MTTKQHVTHQIRVRNRRKFGLAEIGIDHAIVGLSNPADPASFEQIGELTAALGKITPAGR